MVVDSELPLPLSLSSLSTRRNRRIGESHRREGPNMPVIQGLSKAAANYRRADNPKFSCGECKFMFPRLAINPFATGSIFGGCRYVRGVIHADDTCDEFKRRRPPPRVQGAQSPSEGHHDPGSPSDAH